MKDDVEMVNEIVARRRQLWRVCVDSCFLMSSYYWKLKGNLQSTSRLPLLERSRLNIIAFVVNSQTNNQSDVVDGAVNFFHFSHKSRAEKRQKMAKGEKWVVMTQKNKYKGGKSRLMLLFSWFMEMERSCNRQKSRAVTRSSRENRRGGNKPLCVHFNQLSAKHRLFLWLFVANFFVVFFVSPFLRMACLSFEFGSFCYNKGLINKFRELENKATALKLMNEWMNDFFSKPSRLQAKRRWWRWWSLFFYLPSLPVLWLK